MTKRIRILQVKASILLGSVGFGKRIEDIKIGLPKESF